MLTNEMAQCSLLNMATTKLTKAQRKMMTEIAEGEASGNPYCGRGAGTLVTGRVLQERGLAVWVSLGLGNSWHGRSTDGYMLTEAGRAALAE